MKDFKTLLLMQLKDKFDLAFLKNFRSTLLLIAKQLIKLVIIVVVFWLIFMVCCKFLVFGLNYSAFPDIALNFIIVVLQLMSIAACTIGLTKALYLSKDNIFLLTMPAELDTVFFSKLVLYYIFELIKGIGLILPILIAYGINNNAVFYYYIWIIPCYMLLCLIPVVIGAILSIPYLFISTFLDNVKWLKAVLTILGLSVIVYALFKVFSLIPANFDLVANFPEITDKIVIFLNKFTDIFKPYYYVITMIIGGTYDIASNLFSLKTLLIFACLIGFLGILSVLTYLIVKPLYFKMASKQFEFEKDIIEGKSNKKRNRISSAFSESNKLFFRDDKSWINSFIQLFLPALGIYALNKSYMAMNTSYSGQTMTKAFSLLVFLTMVLSFNCEFASIFSKEGNARHYLKTRPSDIKLLTMSRFTPRLVICVLSSLFATIAYYLVVIPNRVEAILVFVIVMLSSVAHLFWCAELDVMNPQTEQYMTIGEEYNNPNINKATILAFVMSLLVSLLFFVYSKFGFGVKYASIVVSCIMLAFTGMRMFVYFKKVDIYFKEK